MSQLRSMWDNGAITADTLYRNDESQEWYWLKRARRKPLHYRPLEEYLAEHFAVSRDEGRNLASRLWV